MAEYKVLIADSRYKSYEEEKAVLQEIDVEVIFESSDSEDKIVDTASDVDGLIVNLAPITAKIISAMKKCKCISRYGAGYDNVDTDALKGTGIYLANVPDYCEHEVSDHAFALFMDCVRKISRKDRLVRKGSWNLTDVQKVFRIAGKTFGFVGYGLIARRFHKKLSGFDMGRVLVCDPFISKDDADKFNIELVDLDALCSQADYISIHVPLLPQTRGLIGAKQLKVMKKSAILINTSRGPLVDQNALIAVLKKGSIACAGLDVFETEPLDRDSELRGLENVTLTDHAGWYSEEAMVELKTKAARNIVDTLVTGKPTYIVNI